VGGSKPVVCFPLLCGRQMLLNQDANLLGIVTYSSFDVFSTIRNSCVWDVVTCVCCVTCVTSCRRPLNKQVVGSFLDHYRHERLVLLGNVPYVNERVTKRTVVGWALAHRMVYGVER